MNEAMRDWVTNVADTFYCIGTVAGPHPYPMMVRDFQSIIGSETREQMQAAEGRLPDLLVACIGGGSNAMGLFHPFLDDPQVEIYGVEAAGHGLDSGLHAASIAGGRPGVLHGNRTYLLMNDDGQISEAHSISAGLDYPGIGPEHAWLHDIGPRDLSLGDRRGGARRLPALLPARRHHPGARARARARQGARARAEEAEGSPDGDEHVAAAATRTSSPSPSISGAGCDQTGRRCRLDPDHRVDGVHRVLFASVRLFSAGPPFWRRRNGCISSARS